MLYIDEIFVEDLNGIVKKHYNENYVKFDDEIKIRPEPMYTYMYYIYYDLYVEKLFSDGYVSFANNLDLFSRNQLGKYVQSKNIKTKQNKSKYYPLTNKIYRLLQNKELNDHEQIALNKELLSNYGKISYEEKLSLLYYEYRKFHNATELSDTNETKVKYLYGFFKNNIGLFVDLHQYLIDRKYGSSSENSKNDNRGYLPGKFSDYNFDDEIFVLYLKSIESRFSCKEVKKYNNVEVKVIDSLSTYIEILKELNNGTNTVQDTHKYFRGYSSLNYNLKPSIERSEKLLHNENKICEEIMRTKPDEFMNSTMHLDHLKKMQHYGVPTRLLDISENPLIALYFAVESNEDEHGEVIVFETDESKYSRSDSVSILSALSFLENENKQEILLKSIKYNIQIKNNSSNLHASIINNFNNEKEVKKLYHEILTERNFSPSITPDTFLTNYFVKTKLDNERITRQSGAFIISSLNKSLYNTINDYRLKINNKIRLFIIPKEAKMEIKKELDAIGINRAYVYPEISEVSLYLKENFM